jgi:hypothetical protein
MSKVAAGWHICLDVFDQLMAGEPIGRIVAEDAMKLWLEGSPRRLRGALPDRELELKLSPPS